MSTRDKTSGDEAQIRKLIEQWAHALRAKDLDGVMASFAPDAKTFDLAPPLQQDAAGRRQALGAWFPGFSGPIGYEIGNLDMAVGGDVAFCCSLNRLGGKLLSGDEFADLGARHDGLSQGRWRLEDRARSHLGAVLHGRQLQGRDRSRALIVANARPDEESKMSTPQIVSRETWLKARKAHLKNEKALTRMRDLVSAERRALPWVKVEKTYVFDTPEGKQTLSDLFGDNSQLIVHHFMWRHDLDMGCVSCSLEADHAEGALVHLENHDVSYVRVSRAPLAKLEAYKKRLGWKAKWVSSLRQRFQFRLSRVLHEGGARQGQGLLQLSAWSKEFDELPGLSVFYKDKDGTVYHTYSSYARGNEEVIGAFIYLDITPKGRNEKEIMEWVKRNDEYGKPAKAQSCCS